MNDDDGDDDDDDDDDGADDHDDDDDDDDNDDDDNDGDDDVLRSTPLLSLDVIVLSLLWKLSVLDMVSPGSQGNWPCS